jgi:dTDP-glucose 4,6-dehydratase
MKILVTGGAGFIGSNFIRNILSKYSDIELINLDKLTYAGNLENLKDIENNKNYKFIKGDICDAELVNSLTKDIDIIFNFAAESHVDRSINDPFVFTKSNTLGTHTLLEAARKNNIKKFIQISTDEVYGSTKEDSFKETDNLKPSSPYSVSKAAADLMCLSYHTTFDMPVIITRTTNNFGPHQYPEKVIPLFITNLMEGKKVPLYGTGKNIRDWIYVVDNCEAIWFAAEKGKIGDVYNIGGGNEKENIEITNSILKEMDKDKSDIEYVKDRLGHDWRYSLDCTKIHKLGWKPKHNFEDALKDTIYWYKKNINWWEKLKTIK